MAKELDCPVVLLHQMTQEAAKRTDPRPRLTDLVGSGKIKNHADIIAFLHRPEMYEPGNPDLTGKAEMILVKNREGKTGTVHCTYRGEIFLWEDPHADVPQQGRFDDSY
jgi:replicative DNA helicase